MYFVLRETGFTARELAAIANMLSENRAIWLVENSKEGIVFWESLAEVFQRLNRDREREIPCLIAADPSESELEYISGVSGVVARNINELSHILGRSLSEDTKRMLRVSESDAEAALDRAANAVSAMAVSSFELPNRRRVLEYAGLYI